MSTAVNLPIYSDNLIIYYFSISKIYHKNNNSNFNKIKKYSFDLFIYIYFVSKQTNLKENCH